MRKILSLLILCVMLLSLSPLSALADSTGFTYYVKTSNYGALNMRESESTQSAIVTKIPYGAKVELLDYFIGATWASCNYNGYYGYVMTRYLSQDKPSPKPKPGPTAAPTHTPSGDIYSGFTAVYYNVIVRPSTPTGVVHMRWAPSKSQGIFRDYYANEPLQVLYANDTWCQVYDAQNQVFGYMMRQFLTFVEPMNGGDGSAASDS